MAYDVGGRGDQSFNDSAAAGLDKAKKDFGLKADESEATDGEAESAREERLVTFAEAGYDPIIAIGFAYAEAVGKVAAEYPDTHFAIIDDSTLADVPNVASLVFAEEQGSFLVGAAAALKSTAGHIGFVGGVQVPLIEKFQAGYEAGAKAVNPDVKIDVTYLTQPPDFSGFGDPAKGKTAAQGMYDNGADIVYHAAGGSGGGVFEAAKDAGKLAIGVDSDQYNTADPSVQSVIMTSMLKNVDVAVYNYLKSVVGGTFPTGVNTYDLRGRRCRLRHQRRHDRRHRPAAGGLQGEDHQRRDQGPDHAVLADRTTSDSTRTRTARSARVSAGPVCLRRGTLSRVGPTPCR